MIPSFSLLRHRREFELDTGELTGETYHNQALLAVYDYIIGHIWVNRMPTCTTKYDWFYSLGGQSILLLNACSHC